MPKIKCGEGDYNRHLLMYPSLGCSELTGLQGLSSELGLAISTIFCIRGVVMG
jgi:hypothetical protein